MARLIRKQKPKGKNVLGLSVQFLRVAILIGVPLMVYRNWKFMGRLAQEQLAHVDVMDSIEQLSKPKPVQVRKYRKLEFRDFTIEEYLGKGAVNMAAIVKAPGEVYEAFDLPLDSPLVLKMTIKPTDGMREVLAFRRMNKNRTLARELNILPLLFSDHNMTNPWYCPEYSNDKNDLGVCPKVHDSFSERQNRKLWRTPRISALIIPMVKKQKIHEQGNPKTLKFYKHVLKSLFGQLALAHRVGVNNFDLSDFNNILLDEKGDVVLIDWNGNMFLGEDLYDPDSAFSILPPEAWFETFSHNGKAHKAVVSSVHALDVWEVGVVFAKMLFQPCNWASYHCFKKDYGALLDATIFATTRGKNDSTLVYVNEEAGDVDLRSLVKKQANYSLGPVTLSRSLPEFAPLLCDGRSKCNVKSFPVFDKLTPDEQYQSLDLLRSMM
ncbi:MAG: hypothetical protein SGILL_000091, partial [Bacillariaceae sp.]